MTVVTKSKTKQYCLQNILFYTGTRDLSLDDPHLTNVDWATWNFKDHKKDEQNITVLQDNIHAPLMNPFRVLASTTQRILSYPGTLINTSIYIYVSNINYLNSPKQTFL